MVTPIDNIDNTLRYIMIEVNGICRGGDRTVARGEITPQEAIVAYRRPCIPIAGTPAPGSEGELEKKQ
jgi:hypothetical protein